MNLPDAFHPVHSADGLAFTVQGMGPPSRLHSVASMVAGLCLVLSITSMAVAVDLSARAAILAAIVTLLFTGGLAYAVRNQGPRPGKQTRLGIHRGGVDIDSDTIAWSDIEAVHIGPWEGRASLVVHRAADVVAISTEGHGPRQLEALSRVIETARETYAPRPGEREEAHRAVRPVMERA